MSRIFLGISWKLRGSFQSVSQFCQGRFMTLFEVFQRSFRLKDIHRKLSREGLVCFVLTCFALTIYLFGMGWFDDLLNFQSLPTVTFFLCILSASNSI